MTEEPTESVISTETTISIERRAKKHVRSRNHTWFAVCAPGLESVLRSELAACDLAALPHEIVGGVEFEGRLEAGFKANSQLRSASRILVRVASFKARAIEDVFRETAEIPWEAWFACGCALDVQPTIHASRIESSTLLQTTVRGAVQRRFQQDGLEPPRFLDVVDGQKLLARLDDDRLTLSLDSTGDLLHRRGWRKKSVTAPIRENLAAAILLAAGYDGSVNLVDAMCGSGTFAIEASLIAANIPPALSGVPPRKFAFMDWPAFSPATWNHMTEVSATVAPSRPLPIIVARDIDPGAVDIARQNAAASAAPDGIWFETSDFLKSTPPCPAGLLVMNPPYGLRLDVDSTAGAFYRHVARAMQSSWRGWRYAIVLPEERLARAWPLPVEKRLTFLHGGLGAVALIGEIPL